MKQAAVAIITRQAPDGSTEYVGVSRREDPNDWNLPGGKVDDGEKPVDAIVREVLEETGLVVAPLVPLGVDDVPGGEDGIAFRVYTFVCVLVYDDDTLKPGPGEGGAAWCSAEQVCSGRFGAGNRRRLDRLHAAFKKLW